MARRDHGSQAGFSMVELMVALVLGVILTSGVISVYISSKATYNTSTNLGQVEETGRYALSFMQPIMALAGNMGCVRTSNSTTTLIPGQPPTGFNMDLNAGYAGSGVPYAPVYDFTYPVYGYEATGTGINAAIPSNGGQTSTTPPAPDTNASDWTPALSSNDPKNVLTNALNVNTIGGVLKYNDVLMVHEALNQAAPVIGSQDASAIYVAPSASTSTTIPYNAGSFTANQIAIASSCAGNVQVFQISAVNNSTGALTYTSGALGGNAASFTTGVVSSGSYYVQPAAVYVFYVGEGQDKWPALWEGTYSPAGTTLNTQELVAGVENMQVLYGVDTSTDQIPDYFTTADNVDTNSLWSKVVAVRVAMVVQSDNYAVDKASSSATTVYMLGSGNGYADNTSLTTPKDQRLRRVFVQTFSLRSVLP